jgi:hypothetical protein
LILAVKDTYKLVPTADVIYGCDEHWWPYHIEQIRKTTRAELWTQCAVAQKRFALNRMAGESLPGLGRKMLHFGGNSGYQAINLAFLFGATRIILSGFDMKKEGAQVHFFGSHPYHKKNQGPNENLMARWINNFWGLAEDLNQEGVEVLNATRSTALQCFSKVNLEDIPC